MNTTDCAAADPLFNVDTLTGLFQQAVDRFADRVALVHGERRITYVELDETSARIAQALRSRGLGHGDRVAMSLTNVPAFTAIYYGILRAGAVVVPLNVLLQEAEILYHLENSGAAAYFTIEGGPEMPVGQRARAAFSKSQQTRWLCIVDSHDADAENGVERCGDTERLGDVIQQSAPAFVPEQIDPSDTAVILYTSGTTGRPKGAELTHANMTSNAKAGRTVFGVSEDDPDTYLCTLPLFHSFGQTVIQNCGLAIGGRIVLLERFDPGVALELLRREEVTLFAGVPTMYWGLLGALGDDAPPATLRRAVSGGSSLPVELIRRVKDRFGLDVLEGYGLSETSPVSSCGILGAPARPGSIGVPIPGVQMKLIDDHWTEVFGKDTVGEIAIHGPNVMKGYFHDPEATAESIHDGWFRTGDLARRDEDGWYYIVDRSKDMIIRGGFNVYPREIEEVMMTHPAVSLVAVVGVPHRTHGEEVKAFVIRSKGATASEEDLIAWCRKQLASYKYPRMIQFCDTLPMTSTGKILKRELT